MKRAIEKFHQSSSQEPQTSKSTSFLYILDHGRKLASEARESREDEDLVSQKYHFLRLLHGMQEICNTEGKYLLAKDFVEHELRLRKEEEERQIKTLKQQHNHDRNKIVSAHEKQMEEFRESEFFSFSLISITYYCA